MSYRKLGIAYEIESSSNVGSMYIVIVGVGGWKSCTCKGFTLGGKICRHIKEIEQDLQEAPGSTLVEPEDVMKRFDDGDHRGVDF